MKTKKGLLLMSSLVATTMILAACGGEEEQPQTNNEQPIVLKQQQQNGVNNNALDSETNYRSAGTSGTGKNNANSVNVEDVDLSNTDEVIDAGGLALVESGLVSSEDKLLSEDTMADIAKDHIMILREAYGENAELAGDVKKMKEFLEPTYALGDEKLEEFSKTLVEYSNRKDTSISITHNVHAVKQLSDDSFAVYFYFRGDYLDVNGNVFESIENPYHIMTLKNEKGKYKVTSLSISDESYLKFDE